MNTTPQLGQPSAAGVLAVRRYSALPRTSLGGSPRTGTPVMSNRAFIAAWIARRGRLAASAHLARTTG